jgi:ketosteroid isomerase-like protein
MTTAAAQPPHVRDDVRDRIAAVHRWLDDFAAAVRAVDYDAGRALFDPAVVAFGTFARMEIGRDNLVDGQWRKIWGCTRGFRFVLDQAHVNVEGDIAWVAAPWHSQGRDESGQWFDRHGRTTLILSRRDGKWLCVHSHYSRIPEPKSNGTATPA